MSPTGALTVGACEFEGLKNFWYRTIDVKIVPKKNFRLISILDNSGLIQGQCRLLILNSIILIGFWFKMIRLDLKNSFVYKNTSSLLVLLLS